MGQVITFYSFKGGVGRTMALANIAILLAEWGKKVLVVDWDLEAPGLEHYFGAFINPNVVVDRPGVLDLLSEAAKGSVGLSSDIAWQSAPLSIPLPNREGTLELIGSGRRDDSYFSRLRSLDVDSLYTTQGGGLMMERVRDSWKEQYDYVLLDSRTGITDIGGICTIHLPDILVLMFTATEQSLAGVIDVARRASEQRQKLPFDRLSLNCLPIPSKFDTLTEHELAQDWLDQFAKNLDPLFREWLPVEANARQFLAAIKIPYVSYFSFGERLAVLEQGTTDPAGLGYAYESVAALLGNELAYADQLLQNRDRYVRSAAGAKASLPNRLESASESAFLLVEPDRSVAVGGLLSGAGQDAWLRDIRKLLAAIAKNEGGKAEWTGDDSYLVFWFGRIDAALRSALTMQKQLAVNPVKWRGEIAKARMGLHGSTVADTKSGIQTGYLLQVTAAILQNAKVGQLIVSETVQKHFIEDSDWVRFKPAGSIEPDPALDPNTIETFEAIGVTRVTLNRDEIELLFEQDPSTRSDGGFQNFLVKLQEKTDRASGKLDLTISDLERIARLAFDYRQGGWQNQLRKIFGRVLGDALGRDIS